VIAIDNGTTGVCICPFILTIMICVSIMTGANNSSGSKDTKESGKKKGYEDV